MNDTEYAVQVRAVTSEGDGRWSEIAIDEPALGNTEPEFPGVETGERSVDENTPAGRNIGDPVAARDDDLDALTYTLGGGLASFFDIVGTGQLRTREPLNHEGRDSYRGTIMVSDSKNADGEADTAIDTVIAVTITVEDVPEAPEVSGRASIDIPEDSGSFVESYSATDPEGDTIGLSLVGTDSGDFEEFGSGVLRFPATPDYENPADSNRDNTYLVRVRSHRRDERGHAGRDGQRHQRRRSRLDLALLTAAAGGNPTHRDTQRPRRQTLGRHVGVGAVAERVQQLDAHRRRRFGLVHPDRRRRGPLPPRDGLVHGPRGLREERAGGLGQCRASGPGDEQSARVPLDRDRYAECLGEHA